MSEKDQYHKLSQGGKWISLASLWLANNAPCSREKMFMELGTLMPGTIRSGERLLSKTSAVTNAYKRIHGPGDIPEVVQPPKTSSGLDVSRLHELEQVVERGKVAFIEVGNALREIRDCKLYRESHTTFAKYVQDRFGFKRHNAYHLIAAAEVAGNVEHVQQIDNPRQAVEVAKAPAEKQNQVVERAAEIAKANGRKPTAATYREAVAEVCHETPPLGPETDDELYEDVVDDDDDDAAEPADHAQQVVGVRGIGIERAHAAIACLKDIPRNDQLRERAFEIVADWLDHNHPRKNAGGGR